MGNLPRARTVLSALGTNLCRILIILSGLLWSTLANDVYAQTVPDTNDFTLRSGTPPQPGWTSISGSPDTSSSTQWGFSGSFWVGGAYPPPTGHSHFMSAGNFSIGGEAVQATITGLTAGNAYTFTFYVAGFRANDANTPSLGNSYRVVIGNEDSGSVVFNSTGWIQQTFTFTADSPNEIIILFGQTTGFFNALVHFSFPSNAITLNMGTDTDNDGIGDAVDLDDDNDGILDVDENKNCIGTPVSTVFINEDFGTGNRTSTPYTNYCYEAGFGANACSSLPAGYPDVNDGEYAILQFTTPQDPNTGAADFADWVRMGDHTGNINGRMAVYNAALTAGEFYNRPISGVVANVQMELDFWVLNAVKTGTGYILPNVTFEIRDLSNNLIATGNTGDIPENNSWNNYTYTFDPGNNTSMRLILINNSTGGFGNDLAIDDIVLSQLFCDSDDDGVIDQFDLDSDNDGIYDLVESGALQVTGVNDANNDGIIDGPPSSFGTNGFHANLENNDTFSAMATYTLNDTDSDGSPDTHELDSDNDACFDVLEAGFADSDSNGILGTSPVTVDSNGLVVGQGGYTPPLDTDNNSVYDFQEAGAPTIAVQVPDRLSYDGNLSISFTVSASGPNLSYQWQISTNGGTTYTDIVNGPHYADAQTATLLVQGGITLADNGHLFRVVVSNSAYICGDVVSDVGLLTVRVRSVITNRRITTRVKPKN